MQQMCQYIEERMRVRFLPENRIINVEWGKAKKNSSSSSSSRLDKENQCELTFSSF